MNTSQTTAIADPQSLTPQDCQLIELLEDNRFNLRLLLDKSAPIHPAQRDIISLTHWARQPHINQALESLVQTHRDLAQKADAHALLIAKQSLTHALAVAASMIPHFDTCPEDPEQAELFAKRAESLIRETRLLARTLLKLSPPPTPRRSKPAASNHTEDNTTPTTESHLNAADSRDSADSTSPDADQHTSSRPSRASRLNRNSRKPAFSPAQVAEILSALLDHEENLTSPAAALAHSPTTPPVSLSPASVLPTDPSHS
jgi:hypothetical protein